MQLQNVVTGCSLPSLQNNLRLSLQLISSVNKTFIAEQILRSLKNKRISNNAFRVLIGRPLQNVIQSTEIY
jgi:hypothetical protein